MSSPSATARDFLKPNRDLDDDESSMTKNTNDSLAEQDTMNDHENTSLSLMNNMAQSYGMFRKYLRSRSPHHLSKTHEEALRPVNCSSLLPPNYGDGFRPLSPLEQKLLPALKSDGVLPSDRSSKAQLTIFYSGTISVFEDVSVEKAQAILLLAGESSLNSPTCKVSCTPNLDIAKPLQKSNLPSIGKLQAGLPFARKYSLQRFLEKRRDRITSKCPYAPPSPSKKLAEDHKSSSNDLSLNSLPV